MARNYAHTTLDYKEYLKIDELIKKMTLNDIRDKREYRKLTLTKPNPILYKLFGKTTFQLWENEEEKVLVLKYIFDFCCNCDFDDRMVEFKEWLGINSVEKLCEYVKQYAMEYLKYTDENWHDLRKNYTYNKRKDTYKNRENESKKVYEKLLNVDSLNDIINIIDSSGCNINTLLSGIGDYV